MSQESPAPETAAPAAKPNRMLVIGAVAVGSLAGLGAGVAAIGPMLVSPAAAAPAEGSHGGAEGEHAAGADTTASEAPIVLSNLVMNPAGSRGTRFLLVSVGFEFSPAIAAEEFEKRETEIRDRVIGVLSTKTVDELVDYTQRDSFRAEIQAALDTLLSGPKVRRVFFPQFVIQ
jgi:flagellar protein FliL